LLAQNANNKITFLCYVSERVNSEGFETRVYPEALLCAASNLIIAAVSFVLSFERPSGRRQIATVLLSEAQQTKEYPLLLFSPPPNYLYVYKHAGAFLFLSHSRRALLRRSLRYSSH
jgi:hypothetical protein